MKLIEIIVENYRSIEKASLLLPDLGDGSSTYSLIWVNESWKSSLLRAIALFSNNKNQVDPLDFFNKQQPIRITLIYTPTAKEKSELTKSMTDKWVPKILINKINWDSVCLVRELLWTWESKDFIDYGVDPFNLDDHIIEDKVIKIVNHQEANNSGASLERVSVSSVEVLALFCNDLFFRLKHDIVFWKSEPKFLITEPIDLGSFSGNPDEISIPLKNCFLLAWLADIKNTIDTIRANPSEAHNLESKLWDIVTRHIKAIWPDHRIKIKFRIDNMVLSFLIEDDGVLYQTKQTSQRSDWFKQFLSFLLTISAQNNGWKLENTLLLLDEPETHLHPKWQDNLRNELVKISKSASCNAVIFATHSQYMIDKISLERCFRVTKQENATTMIEAILWRKFSYAQVNYEVFEIITSDYHNELYGKLHQIFKNNNPTDKDRKSIQHFDAQYFQGVKALPKSKPWMTYSNRVTLPTHIRNCIHHPEDSTLIYSETELEESIKLMCSYV